MCGLLLSRYASRRSNIFPNNIKSRQACRRSGNGQGKIKTLQVHGSVRKFYFQSGKIDIFKGQSGRIEIITTSRQYH